MQKISLRIEKDMLEEIDYLVDYINIKNRSQAVKLLLKKSLSDERIAVILSKGTDLENNDLKKNMMVDKEYSLLTKVGKTTLIEEQIKRLKKSGFNTIYILSVEEILDKTREILKNKENLKINYLEIKNNTKTAQALKKLKGTIRSDFLLIYADIIFNTDLEKIYLQHKRNKAICTTLLTPLHQDMLKGNVKVEGTKITEFMEKMKKTDEHLISEAIYIMSPKIFDKKGKSIPNEILPSLVKQKKLEGYLSTSRVLHLHSKKDKELIKKFIYENKA